MARRRPRDFRKPTDTGITNSGVNDGPPTTGEAANGGGRSSNALDDGTFQARVARYIADAEDYVDGEIATFREQAAAYYEGAPFGDEKPGRSRIVLTEVRDTILQILPDLLRVFCSGDRIVAYEPRRPGTEPVADEATDVVNYVFYEQNRGFKILHDVFKDGLLKKLGVATWHAVKDTRVIEQKYSKLSQEQVLMLVQENPEAEVVSLYDNVAVDGVPTYDICLKLKESTSRYVVKALPPEEFLIDGRATCPEDADIVGHRSMMRVTDLVEMGYDFDEVLAHGKPGDEDDFGIAEKQRRRGATVLPQLGDDPSMRRVKFYRVYVRVDRDGDGIAELIRVDAVGEDAFILKEEVVDHAPYAVLSPDPEPHAVYGSCTAEQVMDLQRIKSHVLRNVMDSLAQSIHPKTAFVEGQVNVDDLLSQETGALIRMRQVGMVQHLDTPFVGQQALPVMEYLDMVGAKRTGITQASDGLDAEVLQSTTKAAVDAVVTGAQARKEMISRVIAETFMIQLFKGLLRMVKRHQDGPFVARLRGQVVPVEVSAWDPDMDVVVNVGLGRGDDNQQIQVLSGIMAKQEMVMQVLGPANPIAGVDKWVNSFSRLIQKSGYKTPEEFVSRVTPEIMQAMGQQPQQGQDPAALLAKVEMEKAKIEAVVKLQESAIKRVEAQLKADNDRDKLEADIAIECFKLGMDPTAVLQAVSRPRPDINNLVDAIVSREQIAGSFALQQIGGPAGAGGAPPTGGAGGPPTSGPASSPQPM
jgi:hypothetical protein